MNIIQIALLIIIIALIVLFIIKSKVKSALTGSLNILFPVLAILALSAIFIPHIYNSLANFTLKQTGTYESIRGIDANMNPIDGAAEDLIGDVKNLFGMKKENNEENKEKQHEAGYFEKQFYPVLVAALSYIYRLLIIVVSLTGMVMTLYIGYLSGGGTTDKKLERRVEQLEAEIESLRG